jgi:hypothetical protein
LEASEEMVISADGGMIRLPSCICRAVINHARAILAVGVKHINALYLDHICRAVNNLSAKFVYDDSGVRQIISLADRTQEVPAPERDVEL